MINSIVGQALLLMSAVIIGLGISRLSRLQPTLSCLLTGLVLNLLTPHLGISSDVHADNLQPLVLYVLLPILMFEACWHYRPAQLKHWLKTILCLALPGVFISCALLATLCYIAIGDSEHFPWFAALFAGVVLSSTDPRAIIDQLKTLNSPSDLKRLLEGESLFNNATTIALYSLVMGLIILEVDSSGAAIIFLIDFFVSFLLGAVLGLVAAIAVLILGQQASTRIVLLFTALISYYLSAQFLHASGLMSVMGAALVSRYCLRDHQHFIKGIGSTWQWLGLLTRSLLFVLMGLVISFSMFIEQWFAMVIAIAAALLARAATVYSSAKISQHWAYPIAQPWRPIMVWGGLRGAVAIALVLSLPTSLPYWQTLQAMIFAVVLANLTIQSASLSWLAPPPNEQTR